MQFSKEQMQERLRVISESQAYTALFSSSRELLQTHCWPYAEKWWLPVIFPHQKTSCETQLGTVSPATYIKCSVGWNSSSHMLKRQPWMRESSVLYSAHNGNYRASLHKDQWWLVQKANSPAEKGTGSWALSTSISYMKAGLYTLLSLLQERWWNGYARTKSVRWKCSPPSLRWKQLTHLRLTELKEIWYESWTRKQTKIAIKDIILGAIGKI